MNRIDESNRPNLLSSLLCLRVSCAVSRGETAADMGFTGKLTIHPDQIEVVNAAFTPSAEEIEEATALLAAFEENRHQGKQAFRFEGAMVDVPHLKRAQNLLEIAEQIARAE